MLDTLELLRAYRPASGPVGGPYRPVGGPAGGPYRLVGGPYFQTCMVHRLVHWTRRWPAGGPDGGPLLAKF